MSTRKAGIILGFFLCLNLGCTAPDVLVRIPPPYVLIDSGFPANEQFQPFWIDNQRVIFKGYEPGSYSEEMHRTESHETYANGYERGMRVGYYVWDTTTNNVGLYKDKIRNLCVEDGNVVYQTMPASVTDRPVVWRGKFGEERPTDVEPTPLVFTDLQRNCWDIYPSGPTHKKGDVLSAYVPDGGIWTEGLSIRRWI